MDLGQTNAIHNDILDFSNNIHHVYFSLLKLKPIFLLSSVAKGSQIWVRFIPEFLGQGGGSCVQQETDRMQWKVTLQEWGSFFPREDIHWDLVHHPGNCVVLREDKGLI